MSSPTSCRYGRDHERPVTGSWNIADFLCDLTARGRHPGGHLVRGLEGDREFADSPLEGNGFKLSVPRVVEPSDLICHLIRLLGGRPIRAPAVAFASRVLCRTTSGPSWLSSLSTSALSR